MNNGKRTSQMPSFEESSDWMLPIAMTFVFALIILLPILGSALLFPNFYEIIIPIINVTIGNYVSVLLWIIFVYIYLWCRDHERQKYTEFKKELEKQDDEEYLKFVELARGFQP